MGCVSSKGSAVEDSCEGLKGRLSTKGSSELLVPRLKSSEREESVVANDKLHGMKIMLIEKKEKEVNQFYDDDHIEIKQAKKPKEEGSPSLYYDRKIEMMQKEIQKHVQNVSDRPSSGRVPKAIEGEHVAAGWPVWLAAAASEAIQGWVPRRADTFQKLEKIGQGTYSCVYRARDILQEKIVALKRVRIDNRDPESVKFMAREILILRRLDHPNIIKLEGLIASPNSSGLYLIFEYMEHDLTGLASCPGIKFTEPQIKCYMQQLLSGLDHCHSRGVLHRDIKGPNLLIDNNGILKIADFGLASFFNRNHSVPLTSRVVTLWYRPPELLVGNSHYGVAVDLWSTGCILGELYTSKPILCGRTEIEQLHMIFKLCGSPPEDYWKNVPHAETCRLKQTYSPCVAERFKDFPPAAVGLMETLLSIMPDSRGTADLALKSEFFSTNPLACDPSSLPKYPPSKEMDGDLQEEARRKGAVRVSSYRNDFERKEPKEFHASTAYNAKDESARSMQDSKGHANSKSRLEILNFNREEASSSLFDSVKKGRTVREASDDLVQHKHKITSHSGPLVHGIGWSKSKNEFDDLSMISVRDRGLPTSSGLAAFRTEGHQDKIGHSQLDAVNQLGRFQGSFQSTRKHDGKRYMQRIGDSPQMMGSGKSRSKEPFPHERKSRKNKIFVSGPLLVPSHNVDQILKVYDQQFQEFERRARLEKNKFGKLQTRGKQGTGFPMFVSNHAAG